MKSLLKIAVALAVLVSTWHAIVAIAEHKADALAGDGTLLLGPGHPEEMRAFSSLLGQLRRWEEPGLAEALARLQEAGHLRVAPRLGGNRSAIYVDALGLVRRIYVRRDELLSRDRPFPDLEVPDRARRLFATLRLAGTLLHELQHYEGLEDEGATYDREIEWYEEVRDAALHGLAGEEERWAGWAIDSAVESARAARETATGHPGAAGP